MNLKTKQLKVPKMKHKDKDREQKEHGISMLWGFKTLNKYGAPEGDEKEQEREDRNNT